MTDYYDYKDYIFAEFAVGRLRIVNIKHYHIKRVK